VVRKGSTASWVGDHSQTTLWQIDKNLKLSTRPWPAIMPSSSSIRTGLVKPNSRIEAANRRRVVGIRQPLGPVREQRAELDVAEAGER
jgi:hypothetical protein